MEYVLVLMGKVLITILILQVYMDFIVNVLN